MSNPAFPPLSALPTAPGLVAIVGGSGFIGSALTEAFAAAGWRVRIVCRNPAHAMHLKPLGDLGQIGSARADIRNPGSLLPALAGADAVVNLVGILDEKGGQSFSEVHAKGAEAVARAATHVAARALVHVSAIGADADSASAYGRSKAAGESAVRAAFPAAAIVRPSLVFGAEDSFTNRFAGLIAASPAVPVIAPEARFQPVYVVDLAKAILAICQRLLNGDEGGRGGKGGTWEIGGPETLTMRSLLESIAEASGLQKPLLDTPDIGARLLAGLGFLPGAPLTKDQYLMLKRDNVAAPGAPGLAELGIEPVPMAAVAPQWLSRHRPGGRFAAQA